MPAEAWDILPHLSDQLGYRHSELGLVQHSHNLLDRKALSLHSPISLRQVLGFAENSLSPCISFRWPRNPENVSLSLD